MKTKKKDAPSQNETPLYVNDKTKRFGKDTNNLLSPSRLKILNVLLSGKKASVVELTLQLNMSDPRSGIRDLRNAGIPISDFWQKSEYSKHKVYFIHNLDTATNPTNERERTNEEE